MDADDVLVKEIYIDATPAEVFPYLTRSEQYVKWMGLTAELDPRPGGVHRIDMNGVDSVVGQYLEVEPPHRLKYSWSLVRSDRPEPQDAGIVEIELLPQGDGTLLRLTHRGPDRAARDRHDMGWTHYLGRLAVVVNGKNPGPDPFASGDHCHLPEVS